MEKFDFIEMKFPAKAEYVGVIRMSVSGIANRMGFSYDIIEDIKIAVSEAVTNVITHAFDTGVSGDFIVGFVVFADRLEIVISDCGESFNITEIKSRIGPVTAAEEQKPVEQIREGGFGLFLMDALMDKVEIDNSNGVIVLMTKYLETSEVSQFDRTLS